MPEDEETPNAERLLARCLETLREVRVILQALADHIRERDNG